MFDHEFISPPKDSQRGERVIHVFPQGQEGILLSLLQVKPRIENDESDCCQENPCLRDFQIDQPFHIMNDK